MFASCNFAFFIAKMFADFFFSVPSAITFDLIVNSLVKEFREKFSQIFLQIIEFLRSLFRKREKLKFCEKAKSLIEII